MKLKDIKTLKRGKYSIILTTDHWRARRAGDQTKSLIIANLTLSKANAILLHYFNDDFGTNFKNWGLAVAYSRRFDDGAVPTHSDGTRSYERDGWYYYTLLNDPIINYYIDYIQ